MAASRSESTAARASGLLVCGLLMRVRVLSSCVPGDLAGHTTVIARGPFVGLFLRDLLVRFQLADVGERFAGVLDHPRRRYWRLTHACSRPRDPQSPATTTRTAGRSAHGDTRCR